MVFNVTFNCSQASLQSEWGIGSKYCIAICCNFLYAGVFSCIHSMHTGTHLCMKIFRISFYTYAEISLIYFSFLKSISLHEFKTASLFFVVIFAIRLFLNYQVFLITLWYFNGQWLKRDKTNWRFLSLILRHQEKKIVFIKKVYEIDLNGMGFWISSISFIINLNKAGK